MSYFSIWSFTPNGNLPASAGSGLVGHLIRQESNAKCEVWVAYRDNKGMGWNKTLIKTGCLV